MKFELGTYGKAGTSSRLWVILRVPRAALETLIRIWNYFIGMSSMDAEQMYFCLESWCASLRFLENRLEACFQI